ncbi:MAG: histidine phosphatase family protein [Chloroflexaceae bacterium]|nr:histidine phosphatase family protein [Chloroflexaceae bacterium]
MSQTVWLARHGNRLDFVNPDWFITAERPYDPPLSEDGVIQAQQLGRRLQGEGIGHIFASPFLRTFQTAYEVANCLNLSIKLEAGLSEWLNPGWMAQSPEILPRAVLAEKYPRLDLGYTDRVLPQYPESNETVLRRTAATVQQLVNDYGEDILLVGHGASVVGATLGLVGGSPEIKAALCCLVKIVRQGDRWLLELNGDTSHLSQSERTIRFH